MPFENLLAEQFFKVHFYCLQRLIYYLEGIFVFYFAIYKKFLKFHSEKGRMIRAL